MYRSETGITANSLGVGDVITWILIEKINPSPPKNQHTQKKQPKKPPQNPYPNKQSNKTPNQPNNQDPQYKRSDPLLCPLW